MADKDKKEPHWWIRYLLAPLIVAAVVGIVTAAGGWAKVWAVIIWIPITLWACVVWFVAGWISVPPWLLSLLILGAVAAVIGLISSIRESSAKKAPFANYVEDRILDIRWRWDWSLDGYPPHVKPYCPYCDFELVPRVAPQFSRYERTEYECEECGERLNSFDKPLDEVLDIVRRKIRHQAERIAHDARHRSTN